MPEFSKPPAGSSFAGKDAVKEADVPEEASSVKNTLAEAAEILGGRVAPIIEPVVEEEPDPLEDIDVEDKRGYLRSILSKERFSKTYSLFGGVISVTFMTRLVKENKKIKEDSEGLRDVYKLAYTIQSVVAEDRKFFTSTELVHDGEANINLILGLDDVLYAALLRAFNEFEKLCDILFKRANRPDFWIGIDGATSP